MHNFVHGCTFDHDLNLYRPRVPRLLGLSNQIVEDCYNPPNNCSFGILVSVTLKHTLCAADVVTVRSIASTRVRASTTSKGVVFLCDTC